MKLIRTASGSLHEFHLVDNQNIKEVLRYNPLQQSARISYDGYQRLFFVGQGSFWNNHISLKNEYGITVGTLFFEKGQSNHECLLEIEGGKYQCIYHSRPEPQLVIYGPNALKPLLECEVKSIDWIVNESFIRQSAPRREYASLLLGLCWYLHLSALPVADQVSAFNLLTA
ncbi:MAG TPA: hypothetical protein VGM41_04775 [Chitinophagaceae bacterium]|jgi:hypothetical protein